MKHQTAGVFDPPRRRGSGCRVISLRATVVGDAERLDVPSTDTSSLVLSIFWIPAFAGMTVKIIFKATR